jgi:hypothetical protein
VAPLTVPTKRRHVSVLNEPDVRRLINKPINNNYTNVAYKIVD